MNVAVWILSFVLGSTFAVVGIGKIVRQKSVVVTPDRLGIGTRLQQATGGAEFLGAAGLVVGAVAGGGADWIGFFSSIGLLVITVGALVYHLQAEDSINEMVPAIVMGLLCLSYLIALTARSFQSDNQLSTSGVWAILTT